MISYDLDYVTRCQKLTHVASTSFSLLFHPYLLLQTICSGHKPKSLKLQQASSFFHLKRCRFTVSLDKPVLFLLSIYKIPGIINPEDNDVLPHLSCNHNSQLCPRAIEHQVRISVKFSSVASHLNLLFFVFDLFLISSEPPFGWPVN